MTTTRITLIGRPGCHLCDDARAVVEQVATELDVGWEERSMDDDPELRSTGRRAPPPPPPGDAHHTRRVGPSTGWPEGRRDFVPTFTTAYADNTTRSLPPGDTLRPTSLVGPAFAWGHS